MSESARAQERERESERASERECVQGSKGTGTIFVFLVLHWCQLVRLNGLERGPIFAYAEEDTCISYEEEDTEWSRARPDLCQRGAT